MNKKFFFRAILFDTEGTPKKIPKRESPTTMAESSSDEVDDLWNLRGSAQVNIGFCRCYSCSDTVTAGFSGVPYATSVTEELQQQTGEKDYSSNTATTTTATIANHCFLKTDTPTTTTITQSAASQDQEKKITWFAFKN